MRFGENNGTFENAEKRIGEFDGRRGLLARALFRDWLKLLCKAVRNGLKHFRYCALHPGIRRGKFQ